MFLVTEADAAAIRAVYQQSGELSAMVELRRRFPGVTDNAQARKCVQTIAGWKPLPLRPVGRLQASTGRTASTATADARAALPGLLRR